MNCWLGMQLTAFHSSAIPPDEVNGITADYLAVERARLFRRLFVFRCGVLAAVIAATGFLLRSPAATWLGVTMCLVPPVWAWAIERRREHRLTRRLETIPGLMR